MDFNDEEELDFEEDLYENEPKDIDEHESERKEIEDPDLTGCGQYLQIDCLDDEEDLLSKVALETEKPESTNDKVANVQDQINEENDKLEKKEKCAKNKQGENLQKSNAKKINWKKGKDRTFGVPLYRTSGCVRSKRWRSGNNFMRLRGQNTGQGLNHLKGLPTQYPQLHNFIQNYFQNQNDFASLLALNGAQNQNMQQINNMSQCSSPMSKVGQCLVKNGLLEQYNDVLNQFQYADFSRFRGVPEQNLGAEAGSKNFPVTSMNGFKSNSNMECFNEGHSNQNPPVEKELVRSKKEARLIRFMKDERMRKEIKAKKNISEKSFIESLNFEDEYFKKMEEQKQKRREVFNLKEKQNHHNEKRASETMAMNKEMLLRKENPFEQSCKMMENSIKVKQEKEEFAAENQNGNSLLEELCFIKKEAESPVKFVRTVSKSFEELGLSRTKSGLFSRINGNESDVPVGSDSLFENVPKVTMVDTASQTQTEPHLTGCIVKILNVPVSTTANDILNLCCTFGLVREVKLNFPKENSVAIRFAEPKSAETFFKLYNGQVINSHTISVIIV